MILAGIDVGITGAVAVIKDGRYHAHIEMPSYKLGKSSRVNAAELGRFLAEIGADHVAVERVSSMPGQGVSSTFSFGHSSGVVEGALGALQIPYELVTPQAWKRHYDLIGSQKDASRAKAIQLYPEAPLSRKKDVGLADALLIAGYLGAKRS